MASGNIKTFEFKLHRTGLIIVIAGMTVLLCTAFMLGVTVGKNIDTYPDKIASLPQRALALIWRPAKIKAAQFPADNQSTSDQPQAKENIDLTFYNSLTSKKGVAKEQSVLEKKPNSESAVSQQSASVPVPAPAPKRDNAQAAEEIRVEAPKQPVQESEKKATQIAPKVKESVPPAVVAHKYIIQAASLKEKAKAVQINKSIATLGYKSRVVKVDIKGKGTWYRVMVSGFESKGQAQAAADKISKKVKSKCIIRSSDTDVKSN